MKLERCINFENLQKIAIFLVQAISINYQLDIILKLWHITVN